MSRNNPRSEPKPKVNRPRPVPNTALARKAKEATGKGATSAPVTPPETGLEAHGAAETMSIIRRAVKMRWDIPSEAFVAAPRIVGRILADPATDIRDKIRAVQTLAMLDRNNADLAIEAYRLERLHEGQSTENVALIASITDEQMRAVAASIKPKS
jgi:hypothetical protein